MDTRLVTKIHVIKLLIIAIFTDTPNVTFFAFHGRLNEILSEGEPGEFSGEIRRPEGGKWIYKKEDLDLKLGDKIFYWVFVVNGGSGYSLNSKQYTITGNTEKEKHF